MDDQDALVRFTYGRALLAQRAYGDALAELEEALKLNPALPVVYCGLADSLAYEGRFAEAMPYFEKAIVLSPHDPQRWAFHSYGALAHLFAKEFEHAERPENVCRAPAIGYEHGPLLAAVFSLCVRSTQALSNLASSVLGRATSSASDRRSRARRKSCSASWNTPRNRHTGVDLPQGFRTID